MSIAGTISILDEHGEAIDYDPTQRAHTKQGRGLAKNRLFGHTILPLDIMVARHVEH